MPKKVNKKISPKRKRRLNPPVESLRRPAAREVTRGKDYRELESRDIVNGEKDLLYSEMLNYIDQRDLTEKYSKDSPRDITEKDFLEVKEIFLNYNKLLEEGFSRFHAYESSRDLTNSRIETMINLKRKGFSHFESYIAGKDFTDSQIENMLKLKNEEMFDTGISLSAASTLTDSEIKTMINLKNKEGFTPDDAYNIVSNLNKSQIKTMLRLEKEEEIKRKDSYTIALNLTNSQIKNMLRLKNKGFSMYNSYMASRDLPDSQIENMLELKKEGMTDFDSYVKSTERIYYRN